MFIIAWVPQVSAKPCPSVRIHDSGPTANLLSYLLDVSSGPWSERVASCEARDAYQVEKRICDTVKSIRAWDETWVKLKQKPSARDSRTVGASPAPGPSGEIEPSC